MFITTSSTTTSPTCSSCAEEPRRPVGQDGRQDPAAVERRDRQQVEDREHAVHDDGLLRQPRQEVPAARVRRAGSTPASRARRRSPPPARRFVPGPASATSRPSRRGRRNQRGSIGTGLAQPKTNGRAAEQERHQQQDARDDDGADRIDVGDRVQREPTGARGRWIAAAYATAPCATSCNTTATRSGIATIATRAIMAVPSIRAESIDRPGTAQGRPRPCSRPRMVPAMHRPQALRRDVGVDLGRADVGVPEQRLHDAQVRAAPEQVGREGVAQRVRRHVGVDGGRRGRARAPASRPSGARSACPPARTKTHRLGAPRSSRGRSPARYSRTASRACCPSGTTRSLPPLPRTVTKPASRLTWCTSRPITSETRSPQA